MTAIRYWREAGWLATFIYAITRHYENFHHLELARERLARNENFHTRSGRVRKNEMILIGRTLNQ